MAKRHERLAAAVPLTDDDLVPVADVEDAAHEVAAGLFPGDRVERGDVHRDQRQQYVEGWQQTSETTGPELREIDSPGTFLLADEQQRDQVPGDDEEHLDTKESTGKPVVVGVIDHHTDDGERPQPVQTGQVRHATERRRGRALRHSGRARRHWVNSMVPRGAACEALWPLATLRQSRRALTSVNSSKPNVPASRPSPLCL
ncbi:unannotated protein [freshwater metagenome]|uniref:Unannotated protein n=1 Tax=freshwater metagenome TaxID=449393 RepID=A0A6J7A604_9ZZZZ